MFGAMRYMLASVRAVENEQCLANNVVTEELPLKATDVFHFATQGGANVCKMGDITGSITLGKRADIILLNTDEPNIFPVNNPVGAVVEAAHPGNVDTVFVDGKLVKHNKQLLCVDFKSLKSRVLSACDALFSRSGISDVQTWKPVAYAVPPPVN
jgi:cytosine/adenosine deaminase-related metal-dependent hydrolase